MHTADAVWNAVVGYAVREDSVETLAEGSEYDLAYDARTDELLLERDERRRLDLRYDTDPMRVFPPASVP